jgi:hypothetical protein
MCVKQHPEAMLCRSNLQAYAFALNFQTMDVGHTMHGKFIEQPGMLLLLCQASTPGEQPTSILEDSSTASQDFPGSA